MRVGQIDRYCTMTQHGLPHREEEEEDDEGEDDMPDSVEFLIPTREDVVLSVVDPDSGDVVHQAPIGTNVALRMSLNVSEGVLA